jgi:hypothetical protein
MPFVYFGFIVKCGGNLLFGFSLASFFSCDFYWNILLGSLEVNVRESHLDNWKKLTEKTFDSSPPLETI